MPEGQPHSLDPFFRPRAVAVVGASRSPGSVGGAVFRNLIRHRFKGTVYPVNRTATAIEGRRSYNRVADLPGPVDLVVIAVPAAGVEAIVADCLAAHVPAIMVLSAGFGESGPRGREAEDRLRDAVRAAGSRLIGPNCLGLVNTSPTVSLNASFAPAFPPHGNIAFSSQSGALGLAILDYASRTRLGLSTFVSVGNKADVSTNDLLEYWEADGETGVILLYVESFGNPRRFAQVARRVSRRKPIIAVKAGRSQAGARAATSHTGALAAVDTFVDALFRDAGVVRTDTIEELFDAATLLAHQPLPAGGRVAILTNAGGPGILAADACDAKGLVLPDFGTATAAALRQFLMPAATVGNPVDTIATAPADHFRRAIPLLLADPQVDALLTIFIPLLGTDTLDVAHAVADASRGSTKPVLATFFDAPGVSEVLAPIPCYAFPESAVRALAHAVHYARWTRTPQGTPFGLTSAEADAARAPVARALAAGGGWLAPAAVTGVLAAAGISMVATRVVISADDAEQARLAWGGSLVLKGSGPTLVHKTEAQAVLVGLDHPDDVSRAFAQLAATPGVVEILAQPMVRHGVEMIVGATLDRTFGHAVLCGTGGTGAEIHRDTAWRLAPLSPEGAVAMLNEIAGIAWLRGYRGAPVRDEAGLRDIVLRVAALVEACPEIAELDLNPVMVTPDGAHVVDARIRVAPLARAEPRRPGGVC